MRSEGGEEEGFNKKTRAKDDDGNKKKREPWKFHSPVSSLSPVSI